MISKEDILKRAAKLLPQQIKLRRLLHQNPETAFEEFQTTALLKSHFKKHKIKTKSLKMKTGLLGIINESKKPAVAIRSDIDALPVTEQTGLSYKSKRDGFMHACGHDVHTAVVSGAAVLLKDVKNELPGCVKFIFQPAEEMPPGGAQPMIKEGVLKKPDVINIFGLHVDPTVPVGKFTLRDGPTMASVIDFDITIFGVGGHAALPHRSVDAIAVATELVGSIQKIVSRETNPQKPVVISFGLIRGGTVRNVIADKVLLQGTARTLFPENMNLIRRLLKRTADGICKARGAKYELNILSGYPVLSNHKKVNRILADSAEELFGKNVISNTPQTMGGEDFAFYLQKVPGAMFRLGIKNDKIGANKPWHSPKFIVDEKAIYYGTALLTMAVLRYFEST